jgi:transposase
VKSISEFESLYIHRAPVDLRKSITGLSVIVQDEMKLDVRASALFIFCNQRRTHMKILYFDKSGFALWFKRLEESKFPWPKNISKNIEEDEVVRIHLKDLELLLDGINVWTRFETARFEKVI